jgi:ABC-type sugar transport system ATPase subunit
MKKVQENVDQVMTALDIMQFGHVRERALNGGQEES